jgi:hypothetical protein
MLSSLSFSLSSSVSSDCVAFASLSLPTECLGVDFRWNAFGFDRETELALLLAETLSD